MSDDPPVTGHTFAWALYPDGSETVDEIAYTEALDAIEDDGHPGEAPR